MVTRRMGFPKILFLSLPRLKTKPPVNIKSTFDEVVVKPRRLPRRHSETDKNDKNSILQLTAHCHESEMSRGERVAIDTIPLIGLLFQRYVLKEGVDWTI